MISLLRTERSAIAVVIFLVLIGCGAVFAQGTRSVNIVGLWEEEGPTVHAVSLRKSDGTYRRKVVQLYDYAHPPIAYREDGHWRIKGSYYLFTADHITASRWSSEIGTQRSVKILESNTSLFKYLSTDGAVVEERRIGGASDAVFDKIKVGDKLRKRNAK